jgi:hypothetical protein
VTGAVVGDLVIGASFTTMPSGGAQIIYAQLVGWVSAADTVTVSIQTGDGALILADMPSGTLTVLVAKVS